MDSKSQSEGVIELDPPARRRVRIGGLLAGLLTLLLLLMAAGDSVRQPLFDLYQRITPPPATSSKVAVVLIDAPSLAAVGGWPWSRYALARLTEEIAKRGASAIGFDFLFPEADRLSPELFANLYPELTPTTAKEVRDPPSMDAVFAHVIGRSPDVVLARAERHWQPPSTRSETRRPCRRKRSSQARCRRRSRPIRRWWRTSR